MGSKESDTADQLALTFTPTHPHTHTHTRITESLGYTPEANAML